uniref:Uncharacterized protein n=1 Tax=Rhizophora mucronata TaxID=61149 RepID=A0A2P2IVG6_RHIMU
MGKSASTLRARKQRELLTSTQNFAAPS